MGFVNPISEPVFESELQRDGGSLPGLSTTPSDVFDSEDDIHRAHKETMKSVDQQKEVDIERKLTAKKAQSVDLQDSDSDDDEDDPIDIQCIKKCVLNKCQNPTRLKKVKDLSDGVDEQKISRCNKKGRSYDVYTINNEAFISGLSFGMDSTHKFRRGMFRIIHSKYADQLILFCIIVQTFGLATSIPGNYADFEVMQVRGPTHPPPTESLPAISHGPAESGRLVRPTELTCRPASRLGSRHG